MRIKSIRSECQQFIIIEMVDFEQKAEEKINEILGNVHRSLTSHPLIPDQQRQLLPDEEELMANLQTNSFLYQSLLRLLAIETCCSSIMNQIGSYEQLNGMLTATLQSLNELGETLQKNGEKKKVLQKYNKSTEQLVQCIKISQNMFPNSAYTQDQQSLIESMKLDVNIEDQIIAKLSKQNQQLRKKAQTNEFQITNMQNKLTKLLKEHEGCERGGQAIASIQIRQQLAFKQAELQRMNQQFSFQIQKYNTVFEALRREIEELKAYQNIDLIEQIQLLQTQIVRLRQEQDRDQIIIRQLRNDNTMFSSSGLHSPKHSPRYHGSRFQY